MEINPSIENKQNSLMFGKFSWHLLFLALFCLILYKFTSFIHPYLHMTIDVFVIIYVSSFLSLKFFTLVKSSQNRINEPSINKDAWWRYPLYALILILAIFYGIQQMGRTFVNSFLTVYFSYIGTYAIKFMLDDLFMQNEYLASLKQYNSPWLAKFRITLSRLDLIEFSISATIIIVYILSRDWIANNICGFAFCIYGIKNMHIGSFKHAIFMLLLFLIYDLYFVFGSNIMQTLASSVDAPVKLLFPRGKNLFSIVGLGDILIPGLIISYCLRIDVFLFFNKRVKETEKTLKEIFPENTSQITKKYFHGAITGYLLGFICTILSATVFNFPQPALLYLVPGVIFSILLIAIWNSELRIIFNFNEEEESKKIAVESKKNHEKNSLIINKATNKNKV